VIESLLLKAQGDWWSKSSPEAKMRKAKKQQFILIMNKKRR